MNKPYTVKYFLAICFTVPDFRSLLPVWNRVSLIEQWVLLKQLFEESFLCRCMNSYKCIFCLLLLSKESMLKMSILCMMALNVCCYTNRIWDRQYSNPFTSWNIQISIDPACFFFFSIRIYTLLRRSPMVEYSYQYVL